LNKMVRNNKKTQMTKDEKAVSNLSLALPKYDSAMTKFIRDVKSGFENAAETVNQLKKRDAKFQLTEDDLNNWGGKLIEQEQSKQAIEIFKLNAALYPQSANTYDSLAEAYEKSGNRELAIKNYRRSLELDSRNTNAVEHLRKLVPGYK
jgi:tetratricopeptide (TPR) repeat protein